MLLPLSSLRSAHARLVHYHLVNRLRVLLPLLRVVFIHLCLRHVLALRAHARRAHRHLLVAALHGRAVLLGQPPLRIQQLRLAEAALLLQLRHELRRLARALLQVQFPLLLRLLRLTTAASTHQLPHVLQHPARLLPLPLRHRR